jgi:integrase
MAVRKRTWTNSDGKESVRWLVDYTDGDGNRRFETFTHKKDADARYAEVKVDLKKGMHVASTKSPTVKEAGEVWIKAAEGEGLERTTIDQYRQHLRLHIAPFIGRTQLAKVTPAVVTAFKERLRTEGGRDGKGLSPAMVRKVITSLGSLIADAHDRGQAAHNAVRDLSRKRRGNKRAEKRKNGKLKVGVDIPRPEEIAAIIASAEGRWHPLLVTAALTGLRASELRGLRWEDVDLKSCELHVRQRADRYNEIGEPKSDAGHRTVPFGRIVANALKEWKLACPKSDQDLVFPNGAGKVESLANIINRGLVPAQISAGVVTPEGKAKYTGMHALRHFYASWLINRVEEGGQALPPKVVQERLGHASITMTYDRYGHLFPRGDDAAQIDAAELKLVGKRA